MNCSLAKTANRKSISKCPLKCMRVAMP